MKIKEVSFEDFKKLCLYQRIVKWEDNAIELENGLRIIIQETESDCCASAYGYFSNVELDAAITDITERVCYPWNDGDSYGCEAVIKFLHNRNLIAEAWANANAGNGGYYYSVASFVLKMEGDKDNIGYVHLVCDSDIGEKETFKPFDCMRIAPK